MANEKSRSTRSGQRKRARAGPADDLSAEITALRQLMARLDGMADEETAFAELADFMDKYSRSSTRLANLIRAQRELSEEQGIGAALSQALENVLNEIESGQKRE